MQVLRKGQYYGSEIKKKNYKGLLVSSYSYQDCQVDWHYHENPYFMYIQTGQLLDISKKQDIRCGPGALLLHNWQEAHYNKMHSSNSKGFHIEFDRKWLIDRGFDETLWEGSGVLKNPIWHQIVVQILAEFHMDDESTTLAIESLVLQLCHALQQESNLYNEKNPKWVKLIRDILFEESDEYDLKSLAAMLEIHPVYLSSAFPKYFNETLGSFIRKIKVKKSLAALQSNEKSLSEVAYSCGFADQSHFIRCFRRQMGLTPLQFRKKFRVT